ncbi:hypothetical protein [Streptomyces antarcticus]|nr:MULTISPECIES: hypothetical protein [unclassified Streptomyces]MCY0947369.1 hypothetical protein [Streptomyces sp. H34-AA3]MCY0954656.1 hypothetical protein [Streptomyces sp. H27-S2]MCZ4086460.1 hypothetical protein [Streptomyces sp. H34-S5]
MRARNHGTAPALLARANRGFARFLGRHGEDQDDRADGEDTRAKKPR